MNDQQLEKILLVLSSIATPTWADIVVAAAAVIGLALIVISFFQLRALRSQLQAASESHNEIMQWNKSNLQNQKLYSTPGIDIEKQIAAILAEKNLVTYEPIPEIICKELFSKPAYWIPIKYLLNHYETICVAISAGIVDLELAYNLQSNRLVMLWQQFENLCRYARVQLKDDEVY